MKRRWAALMIGGILITGTLAVAPEAQAGPPGAHGASKSRSGGGNARSESRRVSNDRAGRGVSRGGNSDRGTPVLDALRNNRNSNSGTPVLDALRNGGGKDWNNSDHPILDAWRDRAGSYNDHGRYNDRYHDDHMADAYRDGAIANAVVNLVGIAVGAAMQDRVYAQPVAVAPAPVQVVEVQPRGYYRTEQILVSPGHYEDVRVWEPEGRDQHGRPVGGYYVVHKRWIPDVYEYRPVWVQQ